MAHNADKREQRRDDAAPSLDKIRSVLLAALRYGATLEEACPEGVTPAMVYGRLRWDPEWRKAIDDAMRAGRDPRLIHGTSWTYRRYGCRCPDCRYAKRPLPTPP